MHEDNFSQLSSPDLLVEEYKLWLVIAKMVRVELLYSWSVCGFSKLRLWGPT